MNYRVVLQVDAGISNGFGLKVPASYGHHVVFSSESGRVVDDAMKAVRSEILRDGYLTDPKDSCVKANIVRIEEVEGGKRVLTDDGLLVRVTHAEILANHLL